MHAEPTAIATHYTPLTFPAAIANTLTKDGWSIAVTGASGWMGQALLEMLEPIFANGYSHHVAAFGSQARMLTLRSGRNVTLLPIDKLGSLQKGKWLLAHCAYGTRDQVNTQGTEVFINANEILTAQVSEALRHLNPQAMLFPSSGAIYAGDDIKNNPYGMLKLRDELHFTNLAQELGIKVIIPRIFNLSGPYINKWQNYALSDLIIQTLKNKAPHIQSREPVLRSYVHVGDILSLCMAWLLDKQATENVITFDTCGEEIVEIADLARQISTILPVVAHTNFRRADDTLIANCYVGNGEIMQRLCKYYHITQMPLEQQIRDTTDDIIIRQHKSKNQ